MDMRRLLVMIAIGMLVLTALAGLSAPVERKAEKAPPPASGPVEPPQTLPLRHPAPGSPPVRRVRRGARVLVTVSSSVPGQVEIQGLGLLQAVAPATPTTFDVLATRPGRYQVVLVPVEGDGDVLGTLVVGR